MRKNWLIGGAVILIVVAVLAWKIVIPYVQKKMVAAEIQNNVNVLLPQAYQAREAQWRADHPNASTSTPAMLMSAPVITFSSSGYAPVTITLRQGETLTFKNGSNGPMWPIVDGISTNDGCVSNASTTVLVFNACKEIAPGKMWGYTFATPGTFTYHDASSTSFTGTVVVLRVEQ